MLLQDELNDLITRRNEINRELSQAIKDRHSATIHNRRESLKNFDEMIKDKKRQIADFKASSSSSRKHGGLKRF